MNYYIPLYFRLIGAQIRSEMQYRASFIADLLGNLLVTGLDFAMVVILLNRFTAIGGWTLAEVTFLYGASAVAFSLAELFVGLFDDFDNWVVRGEFDRLLIRPLPITFQMLSGAFQLRRLGRFTQGVAALGVAFWLLQPHWDVGRWLFFGLTLGGGMTFFAAIFIFGATSAFCPRKATKWRISSPTAANFSRATRCTSTTPGFARSSPF